MVSHLFLVRESLKQIVLGIVGQLSTTNNKSSPSEQVPPCYSNRIFDYGPLRWRDPVSAHGFKENYIWCILKGRYRSKFMPYGTMRFSKYTVNLNHLMWVLNRVPNCDLYRLFPSDYRWGVTMGRGIFKILNSGGPRNFDKTQEQ